MIKDKNLRLYEALAHEVAMDAAARRELTDEQREQSRRLLAHAHERLAELERAKRKPATRVRDDVATLPRPSLLQWLGEVLTQHPRAVLAFRDLDQMSDDDLRIALEDALQLIERMS